MAVRSMETAETAMEMAPGALPRPGRVPEQRLLSPEIHRRGGGGAMELFLENCRIL
jgi:hypothetical protein